MHAPPPEKTFPVHRRRLKLTVPDGVLTTPVSVSVTVAVHRVALAGATVLGLQATVVDVDLGVTVQVNAAPPLCPSESVAVTVTFEVAAL